MARILAALVSIGLVLLASPVAFAGSVGVFSGVGVSAPSASVANYVAISGGDAATTAVGDGVHVVLNLSLTEMVDTTGVFTTTANEVCYAGADIEVFLLATFSFERTAGGGTNTAHIVFGKDTTGAIGDGDEANVDSDEYERTLANSSIIGMGSVSGSTVLSSGDCISLMAHSSAAGNSYQFGAVAIRITEL